MLNLDKNLILQILANFIGYLFRKFEEFFKLFVFDRHSLLNLICLCANISEFKYKRKNYENLQILVMGMKIFYNAYHEQTNVSTVCENIQMVLSSPQLKKITTLYLKEGKQEKYI